MVGATDGVFVVLHHEQGVPLGAEHLQRVEQHPVVPRMKADGGFIEHIAHALQIGAKLGGQPDALRFPAR